MQLTRLVLILGLSTGALVGCGGPEAKVPDVLGHALDDAHNKLKADGFEEFADEDAFDDRAIMMDANWVVLKQSPKAGSVAKLGDEVKLTVGKIGEAKAMRQLSATSPVLQALEAAKVREAAEEQAKAAVDAAEQKAEAVEAAEAAARAAVTAKVEAAANAEKQVALLKTYVNDLDPLARQAVLLFVEVDAMAGRVGRDQFGAGQSAVVASALTTLDALDMALELKPPPNGSKRAGTHEALLASLQRWRQGTSTLMSADGAQRAGSLARFYEVRNEAAGAWNVAMAHMYDGTGVKAPLIP